MEGRPLLYKNTDELQEAIDRYFETHEKYTISGLAYHLGFESRQSFYDYEKRDNFSYTIKRARLRIEIYYESLLGKAGGAGGPIFALKNLGWSDKQEIETNVNLNIPKVVINARDNN